MNNKTHHHLLIAIRRILKEDTSAIRDQVFVEIASRKPIIQLVYNVHKLLKRSLISSVMIGCYGVKSMLALSVRKNKEAEILFTFFYPNERSSRDVIARSIGEEKIEDVTHKNYLMFSPKNIILFFKFFFSFKSVLKYLKIIHRINKNYEFMPACRAASTIGFYIRFKNELMSKNFKAVLVSKTYSPDCLSLVWSAKSLNIPTIYSAHSFIPPLDLKKPPISFSLLILQGQNMHQILERRAPIEGRVIYKGIDAKPKQMQIDRLKESGMRIGIFLSGRMNISGIEKQVKNIFSFLNAKSILIRLHPVAITSVDIRYLEDSYSNLELSFNNTLSEDLEKCDLVVVGGSGVALEALKMGFPCVYVSSLEDLAFDYNGFVESGIIWHWPEDKPLDIGMLKNFYSSNWIEKFNNYDPFYETSDVVEDKIKLELSKLL